MVGGNEVASRVYFNNNGSISDQLIYDLLHKLT